MRHVISNFAGNSSLHGLKDIKDAPNYALKIIWVIAILCCVTIFFCQTKLLLDAYWEEKTAVSINTEYIDEDRYQTVVYCNGDWIDLQ